MRATLPASLCTNLGPSGSPPENAARSMSLRTLSSEFPNANFELHEGAIWISSRPQGRVKAVVRPTRTQTARKLEPLKLDLEPAPPAPAPEPAAPAPVPSDDFPRLVEALVGVLLEAG